MRGSSILLLVFSALAFLVVPCLVSADLPKTYVAPFSVSGAAEKEELKTTMQGLLASRLNRERIQLVDSQAGAELVVAGSLAVFGKVFSIDALVKSVDGRMFVKSFEQGEGMDDLIPAMGRLAQKIDRELAKYTPAPALPPAAQSPLPAPALVTLPAAPTASQDVLTIPSLEGVFIGISLGRKRPTGEREVFLAGERVVRSYLWKGSELTLVAEVAVQEPGKILGIDSADLDGDGVPEIYLTIMDRETLVSRVYLPGTAGLEKIAEGLPYFFRGVDLDGKSRKILVQEMGGVADFYGDAAELVKTGSRFKTGIRLKLPRPGNIYNFARFADAAGKRLYAVLNDDGYLIVSAEDGRELWRSGDKFGGSEGSFQRLAMDQARVTGVDYRRIFLEQRIMVTPGGDLLVPRNEAKYHVGSYRSYSKHSLHVLRWNGSVLQEKRRLPENPGYLADYAYDPVSGDLFVLEIVQREELLGPGKGRSAISVHTIGR